VSTDIKSALEGFLCLDQNYKNLILIKKVNKSCDELLRSEDLLAEILTWRDKQPDEDYYEDSIQDDFEPSPAKP